MYRTGRRTTSPGSSTHKRSASLTPVMELPSFLPISLARSGRSLPPTRTTGLLLYRAIVNVLINNNELARLSCRSSDAPLSNVPPRSGDSSPRVLSGRTELEPDRVSLSGHFPRDNRASTLFTVHPRHVPIRCRARSPIIIAAIKAQVQTDREIISYTFARLF